ncbi:unnamed protein product [Thelazia callipaeda]|uniref:Chitin-binding type-2 domain-containing protein n=1 Tax=Thelazia callipaeda TaxID=103827 RepID=A0A0N5CK19_THECL|nr:unnamed protein product [Thelazia callipaeda]
MRLFYNSEGQSGRLYKINLNEVCDGRDFILLGACSSVYIRCSYDLSSSFPRAVIEKYGAQWKKCIVEIDNFQIFNATVCDAISDKCLAVFARQTQQINAEIEMILEEITFCKDGPGIYLFLDGICSRQAYICQDYKQGFVFACPAEMIMKVRPFGCFTSTHECNSAEILTKTLTSLRQYAIQEYCQHSLTAVYSYDVLGFPRILCRTWYIRCNEFIQDIIYCEDGLIYDAKLRECRERSVNDLCIMPNICKGASFLPPNLESNRKIQASQKKRRGSTGEKHWKHNMIIIRNRQGQAVSLNNCERHFVHCDGEFTPKEFVCAEGFVFSNGRCLPSELEIGYDCWQCQNGMQQQSSFHRCNQVYIRGIYFVIIKQFFLSFI